MKTVTIFGLGFVGLTTALGFSHYGCKVYGLDIDENRKNTLRAGKLPFAEPGMEEVLQKHVGKEFIVSDDIEESVRNSDYIYYCVGTPYGKDGSADLKYLFSAIDSTIEAITDSSNNPMDNKFRLLITKSTIPPSTTSDKIIPYVKSKGKISDYLGIANNPEFLREGHCWEDFIKADRIVIGCNDEKTKEKMDELYKPMGLPIFFVTHSTGEFIKYLSNTLLATLISYSNEMAQVADVIGDVEVSKAFKILHMDKRWNNCLMTSYVYPGCGYGGYCLPKDTCALLSQSKVRGFEPSILREVIETNNKRPEIIARNIAKEVRKDQSIGILGLSFKPESDDVRDTPARKIILELQKLGYSKIAAYDPIASDEFVSKYPEVKIVVKRSVKELYDCSDILCITTAWGEFTNIKSYGTKKIIDCRYMLD